MITSINVKNLFGVFNHQINLENPRNITLILGENGLGKTIILKFIQAFYEGNYSAFREYVYDEFVLKFSNRAKLTIHRVVNDKKRIEVYIQYLDSGKKKPLSYLLPDSDKRFQNKRHRRDLYDNERRNYYYYKSGQASLFANDELEFLIDKFLPFHLERIASNKWFDPTSKNVLTSNELVEKYSGHFPNDIIDLLNNGTPEWLRKLTEEINVKLIETQRLLVKAEEGKYRSSVTDYSRQLMDTIKNKRSEATDLGSNLDRTYPNRVISKIEKGDRTDDNYISKSFVILQEKRELLNAVGLLDTDEKALQPNINPTFDQTILNEVLSVYIDDSNEKLNIYNELSSRIKLLLDIINKRFTYKKMSIDKANGFVFESTINGKDIPLSGLSSGEQHELVLFFELLFNTKKDSLLLIDEPEISLHISWQKEFINDLSSVAELNNLSIIIATHSPDIIGNNWGLTVQLKGIN